MSSDTPLIEPDYYAKFLADECRDIDDPTWLTVERAFDAGLESQSDRIEELEKQLVERNALIDELRRMAKEG